MCLSGGFLACGKHVCYDNRWVERNNTSLAKHSFDIFGGKHKHIGLWENPQEVVLVDRLSSGAEPFIALLWKVQFQNRKNNDIESLIQVGAMCWITDNDYFMFTSDLEEGDGVIGVMAIDNKKPILAFGLSMSCLLKMLDPLCADLPICPTFLLVTKANKYSLLVI